jgi:hypothetical protein
MSSAYQPHVCDGAFSLECSEVTPQGRKRSKLAQTLLNGNNICMVGIQVLVSEHPC